MPWMALPPGAIRAADDAAELSSMKPLPFIADMLTRRPYDSIAGAKT